MQLGLGGVCYIVAVILFILAAVPLTDPWSGRLSTIGLAFFAAGHLL
jgi:VIT1/CCC1 family predicted Fe2+/Mn2+ transporter